MAENSKCKDCRAFQPALYLSKNDRCQFGETLHNPECTYHCITYEQWHDLWVKKFG